MKWIILTGFTAFPSTILLASNSDRENNTLEKLNRRFGTVELAKRYGGGTRCQMTIDTHGEEAALNMDRSSVRNGSEDGLNQEESFKILGL